MPARFRTVALVLLLCTAAQGQGQSGATISGLSLSAPQNAGAKSQSVAEGPNGAMYAATTTLDGTLIISSCKGNCAQAKNWQRTVLTRQDRGTSSDTNVARLAVDSQGGLHVMHATASTFGSTTFTYFTCARSCAVTTNWKKTALPGRYHAASWNLQTDWFALDRQGRPRFITVNSSSTSSVDHGYSHQLVYTACDQNCTAPGQWKAVSLQDLGELNTASNAVLRFDAQNRAHVIGGMNRTLVYLTCAGTCEQPGQWSQPAPVAALSDYHGTSRGFDLAVTPQGTLYVPFTYENDPGQSAQLWLYACTQDCAAKGNWKKVNLSQHPAFPKNLRDAGMGPAARFVNGKLLLSFVAAKTSVATELIGLTCTAGCSTPQGQWTARTVTSTARVNFPDDGIYKYAYTNLEYFSNLTPGGKISFMAAPTWGVNYTRIVEVPGQSPTTLSASDAKWLPLPFVIW